MTVKLTLYRCTTPTSIFGAFLDSGFGAASVSRLGPLRVTSVGPDTDRGVGLGLLPGAGRRPGLVS